jgi:O-antigen/teichoic acid export membrane protein
MSTPDDPGHRPYEHTAPGALPADPNVDPSGAVADEALAEDIADATHEPGSVGRGARLLTIGIASTGLLTFLFFSVASHALGDSDRGQEQYGEIATMWAILFTAMSVFYRPVEQLLSRTIATARARGEAHPSLKEPLLIQGGFAAVLVLAALAARGTLQDNIGSSGMFWLLVGAGVAYAASYFARGFVAGHGWFALYGGLVLFESVARILFPIAALIGISTGQIAVAAGILAAPLASLLVVPWAIRAATQRMSAETEAAELASRDGAGATAGVGGAGAGAGASSDAGLRAGGSFAIAVAMIQLGEQTLVNAGTLLTEDKVAAGLIFSALLVTRAPLQLFQAVQTTLLPHFAALVATGAPDEIAAAIRKAITYIAAFAALVVVGLLVLGGVVMPILFDGQEPPVLGLAVVAIGMGAHLTAGTLNQAALARGHAWPAAACWLVAGAVFVVWMLLGPIDDALTNAEVGYTACAFLLCGLLSRVYARPIVGGAPTPIA